MKNRGALYIGLMLLLLGAFFLVLNIGSWLLRGLGLFHIGRLWPIIILWAGLAFFLPIFIWWDKRMHNYGLAMPGSIILVNGLILLYCSLTGQWRQWIYLWTLEPFSVGLGLLLMWLLGPKAAGLLIAALIIGGSSLAIFAVLASALGGLLGGIIGAGVLILLGVILVARSLMRPAASQ